MCIGSTRTVVDTSFTFYIAHTSLQYWKVYSNIHGADCKVFWANGNKLKNLRTPLHSACTLICI